MRYLVPLFLVVLTGCTAPGPPPTRVTPIDDATRSAYSLDPFYNQTTSLHGIPIVASARVPEAGLLEARYLLENMLAGRDDLAEAVADTQVRVVVMSHDEYTTDIPEHSDLTPAEFWDRRARGLGATPERPAVSCGVENLLAYPGDPYFNENILIHEFAHVIHLVALNEVDPTFDERLQACYNATVGSGKWAGTYAAENHAEYWAEAVQIWFRCNPAEAGGVHNDINTREELAAYDPKLAELLREVFGDNPWQYTPAAERTHQPHLRGWDPSSAASFHWRETD